MKRVIVVCGSRPEDRSAMPDPLRKLDVWRQVAYLQGMAVVEGLERAQQAREDKIIEGEVIGKEVE